MWQVIVSSTMIILSPLSNEKPQIRDCADPIYRQGHLQACNQTYDPGTGHGGNGGPRRGGLLGGLLGGIL